MKKIFLVIIIFINFSSFGQSEISTPLGNLLVGKWSDSEHVGSIIFDEENFVTFISKTQTYGGKQFVRKGKIYMYKYEVDYSKDPIQLDYVLYEKTTEENIERKRYKSIFRFIDKNTIEVRSSFKSKYPKKFSSKKEELSIILKRI